MISPHGARLNVGLLRFTNVQDWLAEHRPVDGPNPQHCTAGSKQTVKIKMQTIKQFMANLECTKGKRRQQPSELITGRQARPDAVLGYLVLVTYLKTIADKTDRI